MKFRSIEEGYAVYEQVKNTAAAVELMQRIKQEASTLPSPTNTPKPAGVLIV